MMDGSECTAIHGGQRLSSAPSSMHLNEQIILSIEPVCDVCAPSKCFTANH
eukprot:m.165224 g.165224  ORF g.165224 m.165224 type:complete len:51 (-) comp18129_c0_seq2:564-716(-)